MGLPELKWALTRPALSSHLSVIPDYVPQLGDTITDSDGHIYKVITAPTHVVPPAPPGWGSHLEDITPSGV